MMPIKDIKDTIQFSGEVTDANGNVIRDEKPLIVVADPKNKGIETLMTALKEQNEKIQEKIRPKPVVSVNVNRGPNREQRRAWEKKVRRAR
jgi:hypothetical protein